MGCNGPDGLEGPNPWHKPSKVGKNRQATLPHRQWVGWPVSALYLTPGAEPRSGSAGPGVNDSGLVFPIGCVQRESKPASRRVLRCRVDYDADGASEDLRPSHSGRSRPVHHVPRGQFEQAPPAAVRLAVQTEGERHSIRSRHALDLFGNDCDRDPIGHEAHATPRGRSFHPAPRRPWRCGHTAAVTFRVRRRGLELRPRHGRHGVPRGRGHYEPVLCGSFDNRRSLPDLSGRSLQQQSESPQRSTTRPASTRQPHSAHRISICRFCH